MKVYNVADFVKRTVTTDWAVEKLVPAYGLNVLYSAPKVGKSILTIQLAHCLSLGSDFLGFRVKPHPKGSWKVLYVQGDMPEVDWIAQLKYINLISSDWSTLHTPPGALTRPIEVKEIIDHAKDFNFIIIDSLVSMFNGPELKDPSQARMITDRLRSLHPTAPIWVIHHKRKSAPGMPDNSSDSMVGSYALAADISVKYQLSRSGLYAEGRVVKQDIDLQRTSTGLWERVP